jgi:Tryptophan-rich sensory protein (mitochondrial benzodiazepine receptor homolog)
MNIKTWGKLLLSIFIAELMGIIGSIFTVNAIPTWYATLNKPSFSPPNWIFGPVWTTLFLLMGVAAFLVWNKGINTEGVRKAMWVYRLQLFLNVWWSIIFFRLHSPVGALVEIVLLWLVIAANIFVFSKISKPAAYLLVPYILWVSFAAFLNYSIWSLN